MTTMPSCSVETQVALPPSQVCAHSDTDSYSQAFTECVVELYLQKPGVFQGHTTFIQFPDLRIGRYTDNLPRVAHIAQQSGRAMVSFRAQPGPDLLWNGHKLAAGSILCQNENASGFMRSFGSADWRSMSLPVSAMATLAGSLLMSAGDPVALTPSAQAMAKLQSLHADCCSVAEAAPGLLHNPMAAQGLERALIGALAECLSEQDGLNDRQAYRSDIKVMRRFHAFVEANANRAIYMAEISMELGVSARTLRFYCKKHLGIGAVEYLTLRRMHMARRILLDDNPITVTEAATQCGFWELGRFSGAYRALFGEVPSKTLALRRATALTSPHSRQHVTTSTNRLANSN